MTTAIEHLGLDPGNADEVSAEAKSFGLAFCCGKHERMTFEIASLRNVVQAGMIANCREVFDAWNYHFPDDQREPTVKTALSPIVRCDDY